MEWSEVKHAQECVINKLKRKFTTWIKSLEWDCAGVLTTGVIVISVRAWKKSYVTKKDKPIFCLSTHLTEIFQTYIFQKLVIIIIYIIIYL